MKDVDIIDIGWTALVVFWIISSFKVKKAENKEPAASRFMVLGLYMISAVLLFTGYFQVGAVFPAGEPYRMAGVILCYAGLFLAVWARIVLGKNWSGRISVKKNHQWIDRGPYGLVRNPIYSGILLAFAGTAIHSGHLNAYLAAATMFAGMLIKLKREERLMRDQFKEKYLQYAEKVRYRLIPFVY
ncbi:MAG TPA: isoprenylcysteine carboxylmethyltransferase family protein [Chitinophagaceae bacterium]|nr:isoprenylcysteine carboxylmethyltransferase family protein [Chitinophagaceae bacterium]